MKQMVHSTAPNSLQFSIDDDTGKTIVRVSDAETGEMIRQIPSKELLEIARSLDKLQGLLLKQKA
jgi:flagellar protein FlaG